MTNIRVAEQLPCGCLPGTDVRCEEGQRLKRVAQEAYVKCRNRPSDSWLWTKYERARDAFFAHQEEWLALASADEASRYPDAEMYEDDSGMRWVRVVKEQRKEE